MLFSVLSVTGLEAAPFALPEAVRLALEREPELRATGNKLEAAKGQADQAGRWSNPELQFSLEDWPVRNGGWNSSKRLGGVSQTVPFPGKKRLEREIGAAGVRSSQAELDLRRAETVRAAKVAFFQVLAAQNLLKEETGLVKSAERLASAAKKRVDAGAVPEQEALRAEIPLEKARMELADAQRELTVAQGTLATLMGRPDMREITVEGTLAETASPILLNRDARALFAQHPSGKAAQTSIQRAQLELRRARLEAYPDVTIGASAGREAETNATIGQVQVGIPLPLLDDASGKRREARARLAAAEAEAEAVRLRLTREWSSAVARLRAASNQAKTYREQILPKANEALDRMQAGFDEGKYQLIDLLEIQQTATDARIGYQQKLLELNTAQAELEALLGKLD